MLGRELASGAGGHSDHQWNVELAARHVKHRRGVVHDLVERQQAEVDGHDFDDRPHAAHRRADSSADEGRLRQRRVADALGAELLEQSLAHREAAAVSADIFAHQEDARVAIEAHRGSPGASLPDRSSAHCLASALMMPSPLRIDKPGQIFDRLPGARFGEFDSCGDLRRDLVFDALQLVVIESASSRSSDPER